MIMGHIMHTRTVCGISSGDASVANLILCYSMLNAVISHVERLLDRISNGVLAEDRRTAVAELQSSVAESRVAQFAFGAMGKSFIHFPYIGS